MDGKNQNGRYWDRYNGKKICENDTGGKDFRDVSWGSLLQEP